MNSALTWCLALAPFALAGSGFLAGAAKPFRRRAGTGAALTAAFALALAVGTGVAIALHSPLATGTVGIDGVGLGFYVDTLSAIMFALVAFVGLIVTLYSRNYLNGDPAQDRFTKWLCLTLAAVLLLIVSGNLFQFGLAWIATSVGLNKLLLFYPERQAAVLAARKKFLASRVSDLCLVAAMALLHQAFGSLDYAVLFAGAEAMRTTGVVPGAIHAVAVLLVIAALLKSAQFPLHGWLTEVMETPTPVSALLHAGVINAGGFLVLRFAGLISLSPVSLEVLVIVGGFTALFGSVVMLTQTSVKVSLAYSTIAQMGFMMLQCGLGAFAAALLHIVAHSLYKAHAFLSSGSVIDLARASWSPSPGGRPHPARMAMIVGLVLAVTLVVGTLFGATIIQQPGVFALSAVVMLGLAHLTTQAFDERPSLYVVGRTVALAGVVALAYFALQFAVEHLLAGSLPPVQGLRGLLDFVIVALAVLTFAAVAVLQSLLPGKAAEPRWQALYIHIANGLYVNTLANRLALRFWPSPPPTQTERATSIMPTRRTPRMSMAVALETDPPCPVAATRATAGAEKASIETAIVRACEKIAPLWPLKHFVAVNPFLGFSDQSFAATCATLRRVAGVDMLMPRAFYRQALAAGTIEEHDLEAAIAAATSGHPALAHDAASLRLGAARDPVSTSRPGPVVATVAEVLDGLAAGDRQASRTAFMVDEISKWCAAYFDEGQAAWKLPSRALPAYTAWRAAMRFDRNPETMGIRGFRKAVAAMPDDPREAIAAVVLALGIPDRAVEDYLHRALIDIGGWAAYARYLVWDNALYGRDDDTLAELLAIRVVWGYALFLERPDTAFTAAWAKAMAVAATLPEDERLGDDPELALDLLLYEAYEAAYRRRLLARLSQHFEAPVSKPAATRKAFQAAFCIDVRSEVYRRALETVCPDVETIGFAGFFGFPIEYVPIGRETGGAQCPVLLKPAFVVCEAVADASEAKEAEIMNLRLLRRRAAKAWKAFKLGAVSSFTYVETAGLLFAGKLVGDTARLTRTVSDPNTDGLDAGVIGRIGPRLEPRALGGRVTGFDEGQRLAMAEAVLRAMSMTQDFARLVLLTGHGSTTVNNPHASGLDCGACGGHTGEANARVAAAILNDPGVRAGLPAKGIVVPRDTWFLGCLHDTTTDCIRVYETDQLPSSHADDLARLRESLAQASSLARAERALLLGIGKDENVDRAVKARSRDWAQVRPEWGLAGNAAFIAAPRARTRGLDLAGRAFLHDYDWRKDTGFGVLELIMTAPMVVASWINLQYYGSTVNNRAFGSGNKVLHNVVGQLGVLEGNAGDLKVGLPWQSVHDGVRLMHEPLRLNVLIEAPEDALNRVIETHAGVRQLVDNRWVHLFCLGGDGRTIRRYAGDLRWEAVE